MSRRKLLRIAAAAVRESRKAGIDIPRQLTKRSKKKRFIVDDEAMEEMKQNRKDLKSQRRNVDSSDYDRPEQAKFTWDFQPGQLVKIKQNPGKRTLSMLGYSGIKPGDSGIIVEISGDILNVLGPNGLQSWRASWVWDITDDE